MQQYPIMNGEASMGPSNQGMMGASMNIDRFQQNLAPTQGAPNPAMGFPPTGNNTGTYFLFV